ASSEGKDLEKFEIIERYEVNKYANIRLSAEDGDFFDHFPEEKHKKMIRKIDIRLVPVLALLYLAAYIDRANIGNAKIESMNEDLGLDGIQYNIALSIFFHPYILLQVPSNVPIKKFKRPSTSIGILVVSQGIIMTCTGVVKDSTGLMVCRVFLRIAEAGFFPGAVYLITRWYAQRRVQTRLALFYCASALSGAASGLLAFAIAKMNGVGGKPGWAWIFPLEHGYVHLPRERPGYRTGFDIGLGFAPTALVCVAELEHPYWRINKQRCQRVAMDQDEVRRMYNDEQLPLMGDKPPPFRYKYLTGSGTLSRAQKERCSGCYLAWMSGTEERS
ncbi:hypothetical protein TI39_contig4107g00003, partial [Zymoseptoria brevis]